jgi:hypothetical protein
MPYLLCFNTLDKLSAWYEDYTKSFLTGDALLEDAVRLKSEHTRRVCGEMAALCESIELDDRRRILAAIAALLHDVARFEQFRSYQTFSDRTSVDHAALAINIINQHHLLDELGQDDVRSVTEAIRHHNAATIPSGLSENGLLFCRLLRDADKLDIFRIALDYYVKPDPNRRDTIQVGIPDGTTITPEVRDRILRREVVPYEMINTIADFKMVQLGWVYDLNFAWSLQCVLQRGHIDALCLQLPAIPEVAEVVEAVRCYAQTGII